MHQTITFEQCIQKYSKNKQIIDKFIIQTILFEFSVQNIKYTQYLSNIINILDGIEGQQLDQQIFDDSLYDLLLNQYQNIKECTDMFISYLENGDQNNEEEINQIKFYLFKTNFLCKDFQIIDISKYQIDLQENIESLIQIIISSIDKLRNSQKKKKKINIEQIQQKSYENILHQQKFYKGFINRQIQFESYNIQQKDEILKGVKILFSEEKQFFEDFFSCLEIIGENLMIQNYKLDQENLLLYTEYVFFRDEFSPDLVEKYSLKESFQFFDKYQSLQFFADPEYIEQLSQDETVLYFYIISLLSLIKFAQLVFNVEQNLKKLIKKLKSFKELNKNAGLIFTMKFMKDIKEKDCLEQDLYVFFNDWNKQPPYKVNDNWINKEELQLYIDSIQNCIKVLAIPELARFFFQYKKPIPFQISNHEVALAQHIIIAKQFYLRYPHRLNEIIKFQYELQTQIITIGGSEIFQKICQINIFMCEFLQLEKGQIQEINLNELDNYIDQFVKRIDCQLYQNIYRQKQLFYTLQSLFIKDDIVIPIIISKLKCQKQFYQLQNVFISFPIISLVSDFNPKNVIISNDSMKFDTFLKTEENLHLCQVLESAKNDFEENKKDKNQLLKQFQDIIRDFVFLNDPSYFTFKLNIEFYIKQIELLIELDNNDLKKIKLNQIPNKQIAQCQFQIDLVEISGQKMKDDGQLIEFKGQLVIRKRMIDNDNDKTKLRQIINECSILLQLQKYETHKNIIKLIDYEINNGKIELFLEYCSNGSLAQFLSKYSLDTEKKISICIDILEGVQYLHENNILLGDLKPDNIVVDSCGVIKIIDYGSCVYLLDECILFTPGYKSNDIKQSLFYDYFSVGITLFSVLLNDSQFSRNFHAFNKSIKQNIQIKQLLKDYFKKYNLKNMIVKQYSKYLFKSILNLFNNQPYLRPNLSELIKIFQDYENKQNKIQTNVYENYQIKKTVQLLQQQNRNPKLYQQIIKKFFPKYQNIEEIKDNSNKQNDLNLQNEKNITNSYLFSQVQIKQQIDITTDMKDIYQNYQNYEEKKENFRNQKDNLSQNNENQGNSIQNLQEYQFIQDSKNKQKDDTTIMKDIYQNNQYEELKESIKKLTDNLNQNNQNQENNNQNTLKYQLIYDTKNKQVNDTTICMKNVYQNYQNCDIKIQINILDQNNEDKENITQNTLGNQKYEPSNLQDNLEITKTTPNDTYEDLIEYFTKDIDQVKRYSYKILDNVKKYKLNLRKLKLNIAKTFLEGPKERLKFTIRYILKTMSNDHIRELFHLTEGLGGDFIGIFNNFKQYIYQDEQLDIIKYVLLNVI